MANKFKSILSDESNNVNLEGNLNAQGYARVNNIVTGDGTPDTTPAGTAFANTIKSHSNMDRVVNFEGYNNNVSTWYTSGNTALGAIDQNATRMSFWQNHGTGWANQFNIYKGYQESANQLRAPIYYDSNDTGYYADLTGTGTSINLAGRITGNTQQKRVKYSVWSGDTYGIGMKNMIDYGHIGSNEYAMTFQMNDSNDRGFWWGDSGHTDDQGAMSLTTNGKLVVATSLSVGEGQSVTSPNAATLYVDGASTFEGDVTIGSGTSENRALNLQTNAEKDSIINFKESAATYGFSIGYYGVANDFIIKRHDNSTSGTDVFTLYRENNNATFAGNIYAPIFYDSNDTSYYVNPAGDSQMNQIHLADYVRHLGDLDTYFGFNGADQWKLHIGGGDRVVANTSTLTSNLNFQAPIFYDSNDTNYYVNPAGGAVIQTLTIDDYIYHKGDTNTYLYFENDSIKLRTGGTDRLVLNDYEAYFERPVVAPNLGRNNDDQVLFAITEQDTSETIRRKFGNTGLTAITKVDDSTAPADGCFQLTDQYENITIPQFFKVDDNSEYTFEVWVRFVSGSDTSQKLYAGCTFYDLNKSSLGNTQRYWGESGEDIDADTRQDGNWYHFSGTLGPNRGSNVGDIHANAQWMKLILLLNYADNANTVRYCGLKFYKSGGRQNRMFTSIYRKSLGSQGSSSSDSWLGRTVMDTSGNLYTPEKLIHSDDTDTYFSFSAENQISLVAAGTTRLRVEGDVKVLGTTDLNIQGTSRRLQFTAGTGTVRTTTANNLYLEANNITRQTISTGGYSQEAGSYRAPIFYDSDDTGRYANPGGTSSFGTIHMNNNNLTNVNHITINDPGGGEGIEWLNGNGWKIYESPNDLSNASGNLQFVTTSTRRFTIDTSGNSYSIASSRAPIFYDSNDTNYYTNPNGTSVMSALTLASTFTQNGGDFITHGTQTGDLNTFWQLGGTGKNRGIATGRFQSGASNSFTSADNANWIMNIYSHAGSGGNYPYGIQLAGTNTSDRNLMMRYVSNGTFGSWGRVFHENSSDIKAPIFYDSNDTNYYCDPNGQSRLSTLNLGSSPTSGVTAGYIAQIRGSVHMTNDDINYVRQLHFNDNVRFYDDGNDSYLNYKYGDTNNGGIRFRNGSDTIKGYIYADNSGFGLLDNDGAWALRTQLGTDPLELRCDNNTEFFVYTTYTYSPGSSRAPIFYDSNDTGYYLDPASTTRLNSLDIWSGGVTHWYRSGGNAHQRADARLDGSDQARLHWYGRNDSAATKNFKHAWYDGADYVNVTAASDFIYFDRTSGTVSVQADGSFRAPIFYDSDNTAYKFDGAGTTNANQLTATRMGVNLGGSSTTRYGISLYDGYAAGEPTYGIMFTGTSGLGTYGSVTSDWATYFTMNDNDARGWIFRKVGSGNTSSISAGGVATFGSSTRSPIFYDNVDTNYYVDPANTGTAVYVKGDVVAYGASDERLKDNIKPIENALDKVCSLSGNTFEWNEISHRPTGKKDIGVIAQEVEKVFPEIVDTRDSGYKAVDYEKLSAVLIEAVKELKTEIEELKDKCNGCTC